MTSQRTALSHEARSVLDFLGSIKGRYILSAQHNYPSTGDQYVRRVFEMTGKHPLIWGSDFSFRLLSERIGQHFHCGPLNLSDVGVQPVRFLDVTVEQARDAVVRTAIEQHRAGHMVTLMWHGCYPPHGDTGDFDSVWTYGKSPDAAAWKELTTPGSALFRQWAEQVDRIAEHLRRLRDSGVPVLWRPYHEMNGVWFWWCNRKGPDGFRRLWRQMYDRFTNRHRLDNLIWVWNANAPRDNPGDEAYDYRDFYPGADCVDVLAADVYRNDYRQSHHDDLLELADGKPIALGEVGEVPSLQVLEAQSQWTWFMPWGAVIYRGANTAAVPELYSSPRTLSLEDVRRNTAGEYSLVGRSQRQGFGP